MLHNGDIKVGTEYIPKSPLNVSTFFYSLRWGSYKITSIFANNILDLHSECLVENANYFSAFYARIKIDKTKNTIIMTDAWQENREADGNLSRFKVEAFPLVLYGFSLTKYN